MEDNDETGDKLKIYSSITGGWTAGSVSSSVSYCANRPTPSTARREIPTFSQYFTSSRQVAPLTAIFMTLHIICHVFSFVVRSW